jgi:hypothetical protein
MKKTVLTVTLLCALVLAGGAGATSVFDTSLANGVIFGDGNSNDHFAVDTSGDIEVGLRAKIPFVGSLDPAGTNVYSVAAGTTWNFDWSVNVDVTGGGGATLDGFTYLMELDIDASAATAFVGFDPIIVPYADHALGDNTTVQGPGNPNVAPDAASYATALATDNVAQNSWRYAFFPIPYDVGIDGTYDVRLSVFDGSTLVGGESITVVVGAGGAPIPEPATMTLLGLGLAGMGLRYRKRKNA